MKIEKNKIVFALMLICILSFIGVYTFLIMNKEDDLVIENNQIPVPELEGEQKEYESKLEALEDIKEVRQINAPSIYDERLLDSTGMYDPELLDKRKMQIVDSIYKEGQIRYSNRTYQNMSLDRSAQSIPKNVPEKTNDDIKKNEISVATKELGLEHQLFFASHPVENNVMDIHNTDEVIYVRVDGTQVVRTNYRLQMRLTKDALINNILIPKNTPIYGFVSFKPNRTMIVIKNINHIPVKLKAYDFQDGNEGIYIENSIRSEVVNEVVGDMVDEINIAGVPQVSGIKKIFQRNHKSIKVSIMDHYKLILKVPKPTLNQLFGNPKTKFQ